MDKIFMSTVSQDLLPIGNNTFDIIVVNCWPPISLTDANRAGSLGKQMRDSLTENGWLMGALFGGDTLREMRICLRLAEAERIGGAITRVAPMLNGSDVNALLQKVGLTDVSVDSVSELIHFESAMDALR